MRARAWPSLGLGLTALGLALVTACNSGVAFDTGLEADMRVAGAQYYPGPLPAPSADGPGVTAIQVGKLTVFPGEANMKLTGRVAMGAQAAALQLEGDSGYWMVNAGIENANFPGQLDYSAVLSFARTLDSGTRNLLVEAATPDGTFGMPYPLALTISPLADPNPHLLNIRLVWDTESDIDLHLEIPDGSIVWARHTNSYQPPPPPAKPDPAGIAAGGVLDFDSNSQCVIDGLREENVYWTEPPPSGHYYVRVDAFSLCGHVGANWKITATLGDQTLAESEGWSGERDTEMPHDAAGGVLAAQFDVP